MWDLTLVFGLGFLGSFGHCVGMCGPITVALALSRQAKAVGNSIGNPVQKGTANKDGLSHQSKRSTVSAPNCDCTPASSAPPSSSTLLSTLSPYPPRASAPISAPASPAQGPELARGYAGSTPSDKRVPPASPASSSTWSQLRFHILLNLGRLLSYVLVGATIGAIGSVLVAGGQVAGVGSGFRRGITIFTGLLLMWFGVAKINPAALPSIPFLNPMHSKGLHERLQGAMSRLSLSDSMWTPFCLGLLWGLIPCGFLYAAQIKAAATANFWWGGATLLAFGLGTVPSMLGIGLVSTWLGSDRRHQLFRMGGWVTLLIGILMLLRTGDQMVDYSGHAALICLVVSLLARPLSRCWSAPLKYRRALGVGAFVLSMVHVLHMLEHSWGWKLQAIFFMLPQHQVGVGFGIGGLALMTPLMLTSFDWAQKRMGRYWRRLHLLSIPALALVVAHCLLVGSNYLGRVQLNWVNGFMISTLGLSVLAVGLVRSPLTWRLLSLEKWYVPPKK